MKPLLKINLIIILALICRQTLFAGSPDKPTLVQAQSVLNGKDWSFRENKGQLRSQSDRAFKSETDNIKYYGSQGGVNVYCRAGMISFVFTKTIDDQPIS